jgi:methyltransferase (TIGR00027 family)
MPRADSPIQNVSDTAFMVAMWRAFETERPDALFRDPLAARLAGAEGQDIVARLPKGFLFGGWTVVIRTRIIDRFIQDAIASGIDTVLNLGAGLDARPYRMDLPAGLRWIEADYPGLIELKESRLAAGQARCQLERVKIDLADASARQEFFNDIASRSQKILVITEGVTPYLDIQDVASLADDLKREPKFRAWIVDYFSPVTYRYRRSQSVKRTMENAPFRFQPADYFQFFSNHGWTPAEICYLPEEAERLHRPLPLPRLQKWWMRILYRFASPERRKAFKQFAGFVLFEPAL